MLEHGEHVTERLGGMELIRKTVPDGDAGEFGQVLDELLGEAAVLDAVVHAAEHLRGVLDGFLLAHLAVGEEGGVAALVPAGGLEGAAGAGGCLVEYEHDILAEQRVALDARTLLGLKVVRKVEQIADFLGGIIFQGEKTSSFEIHRHGILRNACVSARLLHRGGDVPAGRHQTCIHQGPDRVKGGGAGTASINYCTALNRAG